MFSRVPFSLRHHPPLMIALAHACQEEAVHLVDLPYRLSSWALDNPDNVACWVDPQGELVGWAVLQTPFWTLDFVLHPGAPELCVQVLEWGEQAAMQLLDGPYGHPYWFIELFSTQVELIQAVVAAGYTCQSEAVLDPWSKVLLSRYSDLLPPPTELPQGFHLRPLAGESEVEAYVQLHQLVFESTNMRSTWRSRTLHHPYYRRGLDLVVQAPDGGLAAFCIGWLNCRSSPPSGQIEPLGVHPEYRQLGLGRAMLDETLRRMVRRGAQRLLVETDAYRDSALVLYESAGFRVYKDVLMFCKNFA